MNLSKPITGSSGAGVEPTLVIYLPGLLLGGECGSCLLGRSWGMDKGSQDLLCVSLSEQLHDSTLSCGKRTVMVESSLNLAVRPLHV